MTDSVTAMLDEISSLLTGSSSSSSSPSSCCSGSRYYRKNRLPNNQNQIQSTSFVTDTTILSSGYLRKINRRIKRSISQLETQQIKGGGNYPTNNARPISFRQSHYTSQIETGAKIPDKTWDRNPNTVTRDVWATYDLADTMLSKNKSKKITSFLQQDWNSQGTVVKVQKTKLNQQQQQLDDTIRNSDNLNHSTKSSSQSLRLTAHSFSTSFISSDRSSISTHAQERAILEIPTQTLGTLDVNREAHGLDYESAPAKNEIRRGWNIFGDNRPREYVKKELQGLVPEPVRYKLGSVSGGANSYRSQMRNQKGPSFLDRFSQNGLRLWRGKDYVRQGSQLGKKSLTQLMLVDPLKSMNKYLDRVNYDIKAFEQSNGGFLFPQNSYYGQVNVHTLIKNAFLPKNNPNLLGPEPSEFVREFFQNLGPEIIEKSAEAVKTYAKIGIWAAFWVKKNAQILLSVFNSAIGFVTTILGTGLLDAPLQALKDLSYEMGEVLHDASLWKMHPFALLGWPAFILHQQLTKPGQWQRRHKDSFQLYHQKLMVEYQSPGIVNTDIMDLRTWGCQGQPAVAPRRDTKVGTELAAAMNMPKNLAMNALGETVSGLGFTRVPGNGTRGKLVNPLKQHPSITFSSPQHIIHVSLQPLGENPADSSSQIPCKLQWDAIYDLHGHNRLQPTDVPLGGDWPYFFRVCREPLYAPGDEDSEINEKVLQPKIWTQWVDYNNPRISNTVPPYHWIQDLDCSNGQTCKLCTIPGQCGKQYNGKIPRPHPVKVAGPPCHHGKPGAPDECKDCDLRKINGGNGSWLTGQCTQYGCRPGQRLWGTYRVKSDSLLPGKRTKLVPYLKGECKVRSIQKYADTLELGWCHADRTSEGASNLSGDMGTELHRNMIPYILRVDDGTRLIGAMQINLYNKRALKDSYDYKGSGVSMLWFGKRKNGEYGKVLRNVLKEFEL